MNFAFFGIKTTVRIKRYVHSVEVIEGLLYIFECKSNRAKTCTTRTKSTTHFSVGSRGGPIFLDQTEARRP